MKKHFLVYAIGLLALSATISIPTPAQAVVPTYNPAHDNPFWIVKEVVNFTKNISTSISSGSTAVSTAALTTKSFALDPLVWMVTKAALQAVVKSTVTWINSGFKGSPAFASNLQQSLRTVGDTVALDFVNQLSHQVVNAPFFQDKLVQNVRTGYLLYTNRNALFKAHPYTLNRVSQNDRAFIGGNFRQGGFNAYVSALLNPQNNPLGAQRLAEDALSTAVSSATGQRVQELNWGNGFLSWRGDCNSVAAPPANIDANLTVTSGSGGTGSDGVITAAPPAGATQNLTNLTKTEGCLSYDIKTPGTVIMGSLQKSLGSGVDTLVTARQFDEIVGALFGQLVNHVLGGGGLAGASNPSSGGGSSVLDQASNPALSTSGASSINNDFINTLTGQIDLLNGFQANWQRIQTAANAAKAACTAAGDTQTLTSTVQPILDSAGKYLAQAASALSALNKLKSAASANTASSASDQASQLVTLSGNYTTFMKSGLLPSEDDLTTAREGSVDTGTGTSTPPSLYSQMNNLATSQCKPPAPYTGQ